MQSRAFRSFAVLGLLATVTSSGCTSIARIPGRLVERVVDFVHCLDDECTVKDQSKQIRRQALKEELAAQREAELAELEARRDAIRAEIEQFKAVRSNQFENTVRTKLGVNLDHGFEIGQLQVDPEQLKKVLAVREDQHKQQLALHEEIEAEYNRVLQQQTLAAVSQWRAVNEAKTKGGCAPQVQNDCAMPNLPVANPPKKPVMQPLLPTEIPMMLPVTVRVGVGSSSVERSGVRRLPVEDRICSKCKPGAPCEECRCANTNCTSTAKPTQAASGWRERHPAPATAEIEPEPMDTADSSGDIPPSPIIRR